MSLRLANELMEATEGRGGASKRDEGASHAGGQQGIRSHFRFCRPLLTPGRLAPVLLLAAAAGLRH